MKTKTRTFYDVLDVAPEASAAEIKRAYRAAARDLHPDVSDEAQAGGSFHEIVRAYEVLSDPEKRRLYDQLGHARWRDRFVHTPPTAEPAGEGIVAEVKLDFFEAQTGTRVVVRESRERFCTGCRGRGVDSNATEFRCWMCGGSGFLQRRIEREDIELLQQEPCPACNGSGRDPAATCPDCDGRGRRSVSYTVPVRVPGGVRDGDVLAVDGLDGRVLVKVGPAPKDSQPLLLLAVLAMVAAIALLAHLVGFW